MDKKSQNIYRLRYYILYVIKFFVYVYIEIMENVQERSTARNLVLRIIFNF